MDKYKYEVIIYWSSDDDCFIAEVPELPGCMSDGATYNECLKNLEIIIDEWVRIIPSNSRIFCLIINSQNIILKLK